MEDNIVKEKISEAFLGLLMAKNRFKVYSSRSGDDGVDLLVGPLIEYSRPDGSKSYIDSHLKLDIQLKCTTEKQIRKKRNGNFSYDLRVKNYEDLIIRRDQDGYVKMILIIFILPDEELQWLDILEDHVKLCKYAYWFFPSKDHTLAKTKFSSDKYSTTVVQCLKENRLDMDFKKIFNKLYEV